MQYNSNNKLSFFGENTNVNGDKHNIGKIFSDEDYANSDKRKYGLERGINDSVLLNTAYKQASLLAHIVSEILAQRGVEITTEQSNLEDYVESLASKFKNGGLLLNEEITTNMIKDNAIEEGSAFTNSFFAKGDTNINYDTFEEMKVKYAKKVTQTLQNNTKFISSNYNQPLVTSPKEVNDFFEDKFNLETTNYVLGTSASGSDIVLTLYKFGKLLFGKIIWEGIATIEKTINLPEGYQNIFTNLTSSLNLVCGYSLLLEGVTTIKSNMLEVITVDTTYGSPLQLKVKLTDCALSDISKPIKFSYVQDTGWL